MKVKFKAVEKTNKAVKKGLNLCRRLPFSAAPSHLPLKGKKVYLDLKTFRPFKSVENDLLGLGATIENFLSREINYLISSQERVRGNKGIQDVSAPGSQGVSTPSPGISTPSPFNMGMEVSPSLLDNTKKGQTSRGKAMFRMAKVDLAKSVLDNAEKWGVKLIHIDSALKWIRREKDKALAIKGQALPSNVPLKKTKQKKEKPLKCPVVKFESDTQAYKPLYLELKSWPHVNVDTPSGSCPFDGVSLRSGGKRAANQAERLGALDRLPDLLSSQPEDCERDVPKHEASKTKEPSNKTDSLGFGQVLTAGQFKKISEKQKKTEKKRGYCECCKVKYEDLYKHIRCDDHRRYVREERSHYKDLDKLIGKGPKVSEFIKTAMKGANQTSVLSQQSSQSTEEYIELVSPMRGKSGLKAGKLKSPRTVQRMQVRKSLIPDKRTHSHGAKDQDINNLDEAHQEIYQSPKTKYSRQKSKESDERDKRAGPIQNEIELEKSISPRHTSSKQKTGARLTENIGHKKGYDVLAKSCANQRPDMESRSANRKCSTPAKNETEPTAQSCKSPLRFSKRLDMESRSANRKCSTTAQNETAQSPLRLSKRQKGIETQPGEAATSSQKEIKVGTRPSCFETHYQSLDNAHFKAPTVSETNVKLCDVSRKEGTRHWSGLECVKDDVNSDDCESRLNHGRDTNITYNKDETLEVKGPEQVSNNYNELGQNCKKNKNKSLKKEQPVTLKTEGMEVNRDSDKILEKTANFRAQSLEVIDKCSGNTPVTLKVIQDESLVVNQKGLFPLLRDCSVKCEMLQISASEIVKTRNRISTAAFKIIGKSGKITTENKSEVGNVMKETENIPLVSINDGRINTMNSSRRGRSRERIDNSTTTNQRNLSDKVNLKGSCGKRKKRFSSLDKDIIEYRENLYSDQSQRSTLSTSRTRRKPRVVSSKRIRNCNKINSKEKPNWRTFRSVRHFRLPEKWRLLTDRSVCKMLESEDDNNVFDGFTSADLSQKSEMPSDLSYEDVSEIGLEEGSDIEWEITLEDCNSPGGAESVYSELQTNAHISENEASAFQSSFTKTPKKEFKMKTDDNEIDMYSKHTMSMVHADCHSGKHLTEPMDHLWNLKPSVTTSTPSKGTAQSHLGASCQSPRSPCVVRNDFVDKLRQMDSDINFIFSNPISSPLVSPLQTPSRSFKLKDKCTDDAEIVFNFSSPQRLKKLFSPLKSDDCFNMEEDTSPLPVNETCVSDRTSRQLKSRTAKRLNMDSGYPKTSPESIPGENTTLSNSDFLCPTLFKDAIKIVSSKSEATPLKQVPSTGVVSVNLVKTSESTIKNMTRDHCSTPSKDNGTPLISTPNRPVTKVNHHIRGHSPYRDWSIQDTKRTVASESITKVSLFVEPRRSPRPKKSLSLSNEKKQQVSRKISIKVAKPKSQPLEIHHMRKSSLESDETCGKDIIHQNKLLKTDSQKGRSSHVYRFDYITSAKGSCSKRPVRGSKQSRSVSFSGVKKKGSSSSSKKSVSPHVRSKRPRREGENVLSLDSDLSDFDKPSIKKWKEKLEPAVNSEEYKRRPRSEILHYSKTFLKKQMLSADIQELKSEQSNAKLKTSPRKETSHFDFESSN